MMKSSDNHPMIRHNHPIFFSEFCANIVQIRGYSFVNPLVKQRLYIVCNDNSLQPVCKSMCNNDWGSIA